MEIVSKSVAIASNRYATKQLGHVLVDATLGLLNSSVKRVGLRNHMSSQCIV